MFILNSCLCFEFVSGMPPFCKNNRETVYAVSTRILNNRISFPTHMQPDERELISQLCLLNKEKRLSDPERIKASKYFQDVDWYGVDARLLVPPFVPALHSVISSFESIVLINMFVALLVCLFFCLIDGLLV